MNNVFDFINLFLMWNIIYFHVSGHMSADQLISAVETGSITGVNMTKELIEALKSFKCEHNGLLINLRLRNKREE